MENNSLGCIDCGKQIAEIKSDIASVKERVKVIELDFSSAKDRIIVIETEFTHTKSSIEKMDKNLESMQGDITIIKNNLIANNTIEEYKKMIDKNKKWFVGIFIVVLMGVFTAVIEVITNHIRFM